MRRGCEGSERSRVELMHQETRRGAAVQRCVHKSTHRDIFVHEDMHVHACSCARAAFSTALDDEEPVDRMIPSAAERRVAGGEWCERPPRQAIAAEREANVAAAVRRARLAVGQRAGLNGEEAEERAATGVEDVLLDRPKVDVRRRAPTSVVFAARQPDQLKLAKWATRPGAALRARELQKAPAAHLQVGACIDEKTAAVVNEAQLAIEAAYAIGA